MEITKYLALPKEITPFEEKYLKRLNKVALIFFFIHIPVFMAVAWVCNTGPLFALGLTLFVLAGPALAYKKLVNPRHISIVMGITSQLMGGLLVHFGQGPVQIEMHFYFFALLAMICMFSNPTVNIAAAITVTLHHLIVWWFIPSSVFNYEAAFWVVLVHAVFVVLETVAACYISREFFDNVIGLEKIVAARTITIRENQRDMRLILDNVETGLITIDMDGKMSSEYSEALTEWFGIPKAGEKFDTWITERDSSFGEWFELGLESIHDGFLPPDVALSQLPRLLNDTTSGQSKTYEVQYQYILGPENIPEKILVIITDITVRLQNEQAGKHQADLLQLFQHIINDKNSFIDFLTESETIISMLKEKKYEHLEHMKRLVHTLKGNSAIFNLKSISEICHNLETLISDEGEHPSEESLEQLFTAWELLRTDISKLMDGYRDDSIEINDAEYKSILKAVLDRVSPQIVSQMIQSWRLEPTLKHLERIKQQLIGLSGRLGKSHIQVEIEPHELRFNREHFAPFWSTFIHVLRNTIDHGVESKEKRLAQGKPENALIRVVTKIEEELFIVSIEDDGPGIDWELLHEKADELGLSHSKENLEQVIFLSGVSSKSNITEFSGRGVGMSAIQSTCLELGGAIEIVSEKNKGTSIQFKFPTNKNVYVGHSALLKI